MIWLEFDYVSSHVGIHVYAEILATVLGRTVFEIDIKTVKFQTSDPLKMKVDGIYDLD